MSILPVDQMVDKPNLLATTSQGLAQGFQLGQARAEAQRRNQLAQVAGQAYGATGQARNQLVGQAVGIDPQAGMALDRSLMQRDEAQMSQEDAQARRLRGAAKYMMQAIETNNPAQIEGAHRTVANFMNSFGQPFPETYTPDMLPKIQAVLAQTAYLDEGASGESVQSRFIDNAGNMVALMRDGTTKIVGKADPSMQIIEGNGGFYGVDKRSLQASPVQIGGGAQAPMQAVESSGRPVNIDPSLPAHVRAQIAANPDAFAALPESADVSLPQAQAPAGGQQLRPAQDQISPAEQQRLQMDRERLEMQRQQFSAQQQARAVTGKPPTEDERRSAGLAVRMEAGLRAMADIEQRNPSANRPGYLSAAIDMLPDALANDLKSGDRQIVESAQLDALDAALTLATGAAYTKEQLRGLSKSYFPQPNDTPEAIEDKRKRLALVIQTARIRAGRASGDIDAVLQGGGGATPAAQRQVKRTGMANGRRVVEYSDGSIEYAD